MAKRQLDPVSEAAMEVVEMEQRRDELAREEARQKVVQQAEREQLLGQYHQAVGQIKTANMFAEFANISALVWVKQMQDTKAYKEFGTWENFCKSIGYSRQHVDDQLKNLAALGEKFLQTVCGLGVGYRELRKLRQLTHEGALQVEDGVLVIGDESIPLDPEHRDDLQAAMERLLDAKEQVIAEKDVNLRTKDRLLQDKQKLIERQAKDLARYEGEAEKAGLSAGEEAFIKKCTNARTTVDGFFLQFDPERNPLPADATPRMKAELMATLQYFKQVCDAAYDTAGDLYGDAEIEGAGWTPPHLRKEEDRMSPEMRRALGK